MARYALSAALVAAATAAASPTGLGLTNSCSCLDVLLSELQVYPLVTPFCSSYLSTSTVTESTTVTASEHTVTLTSTVTASPVTETSTVESTTEVESTTTLTERPTTTTTVTQTSISTVSCISGATTLTVSSIYSTYPSAVVGSLQARNVVPSLSLPSIPLPTPTPIFLDSLVGSIISSACNCLSVPAKTFTTTETTTVAPGTITSTTEVTTTPTTVVDVTVVCPQTTTVTTTTTGPPATQTVTVIEVVPTSAGLQLALNWYYYYSSADYNSNNPGFDPQDFNNPDYEYTGYLQSVSDFHSVDYSTSTSSTECQLPSLSITVDCAQAAVVMQGYMWPKSGPGPYNLSTSDEIDNALYVWHGEKAYRNYTAANADYVAQRWGAPLQTQGGSVIIDFAPGELVPVTFIWANGGGPGQALLTITDPAGVAHPNTTGFFLPANATGSCIDYVDPFSP
ncbi:hypothetical protein VTN77DRAFT_2394 [Rasamsonia byssochlamydoides]|uniref:uncharacterized protein n=1 Tax=Rasamsonia byssochlamydoides TaxID=89139 RepID=UPI00374279CB